MTASSMAESSMTEASSTGGLRRTLAMGAAAVALAGGVLFSAAATTSAAPRPDDENVATQQIDRGERCHVVHRHWTRVWHPAWKDRHGKRHPGYWTRVLHRAHLVCRKH
ncbi:hypothetical protein ACF082_22305 [Streptomyces lydicus]|uniref:hypothetical protein n=1 Tax=Streptomyces lydicus TaxID=47763 RepID=UPI0036F8058E